MIINIVKRATLNNLIENASEALQDLDQQGYPEFLKEIDKLHEHAHRYNPNQTDGWINTIREVSGEARAIEAHAFEQAAAKSESNAHTKPNSLEPADCLEGYVYGVVAWAVDRGIIAAADRKAQLLKTMSELGELADAVAKDDKESIMDGIGDAMVTLIIQAAMNNTHVLDCLRMAFNEIKSRKGKMVNGTFVKDEA